MRHGYHGHELSNTPMIGASPLAVPARKVKLLGLRTNLSTPNGKHLYADHQLDSGNPFLWSEDGQMFAPEGVADPRFKMIYTAELRPSPFSPQVSLVKVDRNGRLRLMNGIPARGGLIYLPNGADPVPLSR